MFVSQSKLARILGISQPSISSAIKRGKLISVKKGIDTNNLFNQQYIKAAEIRADRKRNKHGKLGSTDSQKRIDEENDRRQKESQNEIERLKTEYDSRLVPENYSSLPIDLENIDETNIQNYAKIDIDKLKIIEQTKIFRLKALKERGKLIDSDNVKTVLTKIISIEENELKTIPSNVTAQLVGYFGNDDPKINNEVRKKLEKEIFKVLRRIKDTVNVFLTENKCT